MALCSLQFYSHQGQFIINACVQSTVNYIGKMLPLNVKMCFICFICKPLTLCGTGNYPRLVFLC